MGDFELDTRLNGGAGRYRARLSPDWEIWGPNGGYVASIALRAVGNEASIRRPVSFSGHFLAVARFGEVTVEVAPIRVGRRSESFRVAIHQEERPVFEAIVRTAAAGEGLRHDVGKTPDVPPPEAIEAPPDESGYVFWQNLERRWVEPGGERDGAPKPPSWKSWHRFTPRATFDDPFVDAGRSLLLIDTMSWPAACLPHPDAEFIAPNLDVTAWFHRAAPDSDWLLVEHGCPVAEDGLMGTVGRVWSRDGRLLASGGAQLYCMPIPASVAGA